MSATPGIGSASFAGVDVGGTHVRVTVGAASSRHGPKVVVHRLPPDYASLVRSLVAWVGEDVVGIGIGLPGRIDGGRATWVPNVPYLDGRDLAGDVLRQRGASVTLANDAQCALLGELRTGAARGVASVALVTIGTGIGGAMAYGGKLVRGAHGTAGAFGWLPAIEPQRNPAGAGHVQGPWEQQASGSALRQLAAAAGMAQGLTLPPRDAVADALLERYLDLVAPGLAAIASMLDPALLLLGGGVAEVLAVRLDRLRSRVEAHASPVARGLEIRIAQHGAAAGAMGAWQLAMEGEGAYLG